MITLFIVLIYLLHVQAQEASNENDLSLFDFTPDGAVGQLLYCSKAIETRGAPVIAFCNRALDTTVLITGRTVFHSLQIPPSPGPLFLKNGVVAGISGKWGVAKCGQ